MVKAGFKETEIGVIPEDWEVVTLGALGEFKNGINKPADQFGFGKPFVNLMDVFGIPSISEVSGLGLLNTSNFEHDQYALEEGDVLFVRSSVKPSGVGLTTLIKSDLPETVFSGFLIRYRNRSIDSSFKEHCFYRGDFRKRVIAASTSSANTNINQSNLAPIKFVLPSTVEEQKAIAGALSDVDGLIAGLEALIAKKRALKTATMQQLLTGKTRLPGFGEGFGMKQTELGEIPEDWEILRIDDCATKVGSGITPRGGSNVYKDIGRPFVRSQNVGWGMPRKDELAFIDEITHQSFSATEIVRNDVLLNITGASIGRSCVADRGFVGGNVNQHVCLIRTNEKLNHTLLSLLILSDLGQRQIDSFQAGGNREGLNFGQVRSIRFLVSSNPQEQECIAAIADDMEQQLNSMTQQLLKAKALKKGMMQELLTGRTRLI